MSRASDVVRAFLREHDGSTQSERRGDERLAFDALAILADRYDRHLDRVTPVATTPRSALGARRSDSVLRELIRGSTEEIVVLGYEVSDVDIISALAERASLGASVDLLVDSVQTPVSRLIDVWPDGAGPARIWTTTNASNGRPYRLHAKAVISDQRRCMVGSANLTYSGLHTNLELGVLIEGSFARRLRRYVSEMVRRKLVEQAAVIGNDPHVPS